MYQTGAKLRSVSASSGQSSRPGVSRERRKLATCPFCQNENVVYAQFCGTCGKSVHEKKTEKRRKLRVIGHSKKSELTKFSEQLVLFLRSFGSRLRKIGFPFKRTNLAPRPEPPEKRISGGGGTTAGRQLPPSRGPGWGKFSKAPLVLFLLAFTGYFLVSALMPSQGQSSCTADDLRTTQGQETITSQVFQDVSGDHPLYRAWKPLRQLGIPLADASGNALPQGPLTWEAWQKAVILTLAFYPISNEAQNLFLSGKHGSFSGRQLSDQLCLLARFWKLQPPQIYFDDSQAPNRMEAFAAFSSLISKIQRP